MRHLEVFTLSQGRIQKRELETPRTDTAKRDLQLQLHL